MAEKTTNFGLTKPTGEEFYDVNVQNENMDIIDEELKKRIPCLAEYYNDGKSADELVDPFALIPISLEVNAELFNIVGGTFAWVWTNFYIEASVTSRRMQIAMSYNTINHKMAFRIYGANGWLEWKELATSDLIPKNASDIGLGNVPNVTTNDQTPTYTEASSLATLTSGEKLSIAFGKIKKAITDLISHIGNKNNPHSVTASQIGAATNDHTHDVEEENITGVLPISKGGTGSTSATAAITNLGAAKNVHKHTASDIDSGTLSSDRLPVVPITKGGTGAADSSQARANLGLTAEYWTFTLEDGTTVTKLVYAT